MHILINNPHPSYDAMFSAHLDLTQRTQAFLKTPFQEWVRLSLEALQSGKKMFFFGNGGSAADAQHLAAECVVRFEKERCSLPALALTTDTSILTAAGNDLGFDHIFSRQIEAFGQAGDIAVALTTSGKSPNIHAALRAAHCKNMVTVALTGEKGPEHLASLTDLILAVPSITTARIQEMHILLGHMLCAMIDHAFSPSVSS